MHLKTLQKIFANVDTLLDDPDFIQKNKVGKTSFTRKRALDFKTTFYAVCSSGKGSLSTELTKFENNAEGNVSHFSAQAFSKARYKIKSAAFYNIFRESAKIFCAQKEFQTLWGYRVFAVDGTSLILPESKENHRSFGSGGTKEKTYAMASASIFYDVLNDIVLDGTIGRYQTSERKSCYKMLKRTNTKFTGKNKLILLDRGYQSREMYHFLQDHGYKYVIRVQCGKSTPKAIRAAQGDDCMVTDARDKTLVHRVIKITLESGETEILVTNLFDQSLTVEDFYQLYHLRWKIETKYSEIKHKFKLEKFTGYRPEGIRQDFYAVLFLSCLTSLTKHESEARRVKKKNTKWDYQINILAVINALIDNITRLFYAGKSLIECRLTLLVDSLKNKRSVIRPDRHTERKKPRTVKRYYLNPNYGQTLTKDYFGHASFLPGFINYTAKS